MQPPLAATLRRAHTEITAMKPARAVICACALVVVAPARSATITYVVDPARSQLIGSGTVRNIALSPQKTNGLAGAVGGSLVATWQDSGLTFAGGSMLVATPHPEAPFVPTAAAAGSGSMIDNFGAQGVVFGWAVRSAGVGDAVADMPSGSAQFGGPVMNIEFGFIEGTVDYHDQFNGELDWIGLNELDTVFNLAAGNLVRTVEDNLDTITLPISVDLMFGILEPDDSRLALAGQIVATSPVLVIEAGTTTTIATPQHLAGLNVGANGKATFAAGGAKNLVAAAVSIAGGTTPTGTLDLTDNALIVDYPVAGPNPATEIRGQIIAGRGAVGLGATWTGKGITSSTAAAQVTSSPESVSVAYAVNGTLPLGPYAMFRGAAVDASTVLVRYTRTGDANLDGVVNDDDVTIVGASYAPGMPKASWALGDFDYNGFVDDDDVTLLGVFYNPAAAPIPSPETVSEGTPVLVAAAVPEPGSWLLFLLAALIAGLLVTRRPR
jgi:hypothetical protein